MDRIWNVLWILFLVSAFMSWIQTRLLEGARLRSLRRLEGRRGSRVITLIHCQESRTLLGIPVMRYIDIDDSEGILRAIPADAGGHADRLGPPGRQRDVTSAGYPESDARQDGSRAVLQGSPAGLRRGAPSTGGPRQDGVS
jgi:hypothetical protein